MITQTYTIRRNYENHMLYFDTKELVDLCLQHHILQGETKKWIAVYHEASKTQPEEYPEGWYKDDYEMTVQTLMCDDDAINLLLQALSEKDILFVPSLDTNLIDKDLLSKGESV